MQPSPSSSSLKGKSNPTVVAPGRLTEWAVWLCRLVVGVTFVASGIAKSIDLWGFVYKIDQYLAVWHMPVTHGMVLAAATLLSTVEFLAGFLLLTGSYKRTVAWVIAAMMAAMLPLTLYIAVANPVADCGCFGDMWVISNSATFGKNLLLSAMAIFLVMRNSRVQGLFTTYSQWLVAVIALGYVLTVAMWGYTVQPLVDFRPYPVGTNLGALAEATTSTAGDDDTEYIFIYKKGDVTREFTVDSLPDDTWEFVDRREVEAESSDVSPKSEGAKGSAVTMMTLYDEEGNDVTAEAISRAGEQVLLLIPDMSGIDVSATYYLNELDVALASRGGSMAAIVPSETAAEVWRDLSMAQYPIYITEDTSIKELARGAVAMVYLRDGRIVWKRTLSSIDTDLHDGHSNKPLPSLAIAGDTWMAVLTGCFLLLELILWALDRSGRAVKLHVTRRRQKSA